MEASPAANGPTTASLQGPQPGGRTIAPASKNISMRPSLTIRLIDCCEPGTINSRTLLATFRPFKTLAACNKSSYMPEPHEPIKACWIGVPIAVDISTALPTPPGRTICGSIWDKSIENCASKFASSSLNTGINSFFA